MKAPFWKVVSVSAALASCGGAPATPAADPAGSGKPEPPDPAMAELSLPPSKPYVAPLTAEEAAQQLGADARKLTQIEQLSPRSHEALLKSYLFKPIAECDGLQLVPVQPAPGLILPPKGDPPRVRADVLELLKQAGALAQQRGTAIEVLSGHETVAEAVKRWNVAALDKAIEIARAVSVQARKEKSVMGAARKRLDPEANPRSWGDDPCKTGRLSGASVDVQLVGLSAGGGRGKVLVKGGPEADRFERDTYSTSYWDKAQGKSYRLLNEIMTAGKFVRQCSVASRFTAMPEFDGTWRCREQGESWEPADRPLPPWQ